MSDGKVTTEPDTLIVPEYSGHSASAALHAKGAAGHRDLQECLELRFEFSNRNLL